MGYNGKVRDTAAEMQRLCDRSQKRETINMRPLGPVYAGLGGFHFARKSRTHPVLSKISPPEQKNHKKRLTKQFAKEFACYTQITKNENDFEHR